MASSPIDSTEIPLRVCQSHQDAPSDGGQWSSTLSLVIMLSAWQQADHTSVEGTGLGLIPGAYTGFWKGGWGGGVQVSVK